MELVRSVVAGPVERGFECATGRSRVAGSARDNKLRRVDLRLDVEVIEYFKAGGPGWQTRINEHLRQALPAARGKNPAPWPARKAG